jgi:hypothetical protein
MGRNRAGFDALLATSGQYASKLKGKLHAIWDWLIPTPSKQAAAAKAQKIVNYRYLHRHVAQ